MDVARSAQRCLLERTAALADLAPVAARTGPGWLAVRSGAESNDLNAVVGEPGHVPPADALPALREWYAGVPARWLVADPDHAVTDALVADGWRPERTGRVCGRRLGAGHAPVGRPDVARVGADGALEEWLDVAGSCDWFQGPAEREVRSGLAAAMRQDARRGFWVARVDGHAVGMASGWCAGTTVEVVDVAVREEGRRRGVGTGLVAAVLGWGADLGATEVVAAPSPDGWRLFESLGFVNVPDEPDVCFYMP